MQRREGLPCNWTKGGIFLQTSLFFSKADLCSANLTSEVIFFNETVRVASSTNASELNE